MDEAAVPANEEQPPPPPLLPPPPLSLQKALQQCELVQNMIDISISNLEGLRTKCATSNDLTQKEIRTLEVSGGTGRRGGGGGGRRRLFRPLGPRRLRHAPSQGGLLETPAGEERHRGCAPCRCPKALLVLSCSKKGGISPSLYCSPPLGFLFGSLFPPPKIIIIILYHLPSTFVRAPTRTTRRPNAERSSVVVIPKGRLCRGS